MIVAAARPVISRIKSAARWRRSLAARRPADRAVGTVVTAGR